MDKSFGENKNFRGALQEFGVNMSTLLFYIALAPEATSPCVIVSSILASLTLNVFFCWLHPNLGNYVTIGVALSVGSLLGRFLNSCYPYNNSSELKERHQILSAKVGCIIALILAFPVIIKVVVVLLALYIHCLYKDVSGYIEI